MDEKLLKLGIAGTGRMAATYARAAASMKTVTLASVFSKNCDRAAQFANHYAVSNSTSDIEVFLDNSDAVYVATETHRHAALVEFALNAGKPVLVEKPLSLDLKTTQRLLDLSRANQVLMVEAIWTLLLPAFLALQKKSTNGDVGKPHRFHFDFSNPVLLEDVPKLFDPFIGGGVLLDRAVYGVAAARVLLGPIDSQQVTLSYRNPSGVETDAFLHLIHSSGGQSLITLSFDVAGENKLGLSCEHGYLSLSPTSLAVEILNTKNFMATLLSTNRSPLLQPWLKQKPFLRKLKHFVMQLQGQAHSYGSDPYRPMLEHFVDLVSRKACASKVITPELMQDVAIIVAKARGK